MTSEPTPTEIMAAIVDLQRAVGHGFAQVDQRFAQVDQRFERLEVRVTSIESEVKGIHRWMARGDERFDSIERRLA